MQEQSAPETAVENDPWHDFSDIQVKQDGSFILTLNGCPFHATHAETPEVHARITRALEAGAGSTPYVEPVPTPEENEQRERIWRDQQINGVSWLRERHRDELQLERQTSLTPEQYAELLDYLQALRDWPQSLEFPASSSRPAAPPWITSRIH